MNFSSLLALPVIGKNDYRFCSFFLPRNAHWNSFFSPCLRAQNMLPFKKMQQGLATLISSDEEGSLHGIR
ncbi:hypothetical protein KDA_52660 [Dictyobacter alpinus]|uniref:Uncharacterized protein n=1 Tax=Dictyobacter alpinus TaxID=2014873 RepID=A0A402BER9_9CHLR|nr:hypothetical protein [Dictyobacter alpinus]GCE29782.1 hypothetical protein KDA_52660 [Dictyobacter alpinus]